MTKGGAHYRGLKIEVQDFSQKHDLNGTEHSFLKYVSRCYAKNLDIDISDKAWWFVFGETTSGTKPQDAIRAKDENFIRDLLFYCYANDFKEWQVKVLVAYFNREFADVKRFLEQGIEDLQRYRESESIPE